MKFAKLLQELILWWEGSVNLAYLSEIFVDLPELPVDKTCASRILIRFLVTMLISKLLSHLFMLMQVRLCTYVCVCVHAHACMCVQCVYVFVWWVCGSVCMYLYGGCVVCVWSVCVFVWCVCICMVVCVWCVCIYVTVNTESASSLGVSTPRSFWPL